MLGNQADLFMTTPMRTSVITQATQHAAEMPAPRPTARVGNSGFLPSLGGAETLPGMNGCSTSWPSRGVLLAVAIGGLLVLASRS